MIEISTVPTPVPPVSALVPEKVWTLYGSCGEALAPPTVHPFPSTLQIAVTVPVGAVLSMVNVAPVVGIAVMIFVARSVPVPRVTVATPSPAPSV